MMNKRTLGLGMSVLLWGGAIVEGFKILEDYAATPGPTRDTPHVWPANSKLEAAPSGQAGVVLFIHPKCPCSRATLSELGTLLARTQKAAKVVQIVFVTPPGWSEAEVRASELWNPAQEIPGTGLVIDDGSEARKFGALTSGHLFVFDDHGQLAFNGGITPRRGHAGDNRGLNAAVAALNQGESPVKVARIFGCTLFSSMSEARAR